MKKWSTLLVLCFAQFLMVLDTSVMNVAISQLIEDFDAEVTQIQTAITFYSLVMAAFMLLGGKLGDVWGRRRAFGIGMAVYAAGSALTAVAWAVPVLTFGWSFLEGIGAALVLPAMAALVAGAYRGGDRAVAFGLLRAYVCAGSPAQDLEPWEGYEGWSDLVRSAIVCGSRLPPQASDMGSPSTVSKA